MNRSLAEPILQRLVPESAEAAREEPPALAQPERVAAVAPPATASRRVELDLGRLAAAGFVTPDAPRSRIAEQFRVIKRTLIGNARARSIAPLSHGRLVMLTSALAGEGKTFTSINLAMSLATELDCSVMLVDADMSRSTMLDRLGLPPGPGLLDLLESRVGMADVLLRTNIDKLSLLPCGTPHPRATELLASDAMRRLLDEMAERYPDRFIVFDSPPLLLTTEARVLASRMGQIVVVVQAGRTLQSDVRRAIETIEGCPQRMVLLNQMRGDAADGYGYGYGYGHGPAR